MTIIADSGSTKSDWMVVDGDHKQLYTTIGFNPFLQSKDFIIDNISQNAPLLKVAIEVERVFFYGAGCSSNDLCVKMHTALSKVFQNATIEVNHDTMASVFATYSGEPGISCILGTGSNSCFYDGVKAYEEVPALGYILGDEGSGSYFGKRLMRDFLYNRMPHDFAVGYQKKFNLSKEAILENVLSKPNANVYLASFASFMDEFRTSDYVQIMLQEGFTEFLSIHVQCFEKYRDVPTHFIGSIAYYYQKELREAAIKLGVRVGNIVHKPIDGLVQYHLSK